MCVRSNHCCEKRCDTGGVVVQEGPPNLVATIQAEVTTGAGERSKVRRNFCHSRVAVDFLTKNFQRGNPLSAIPQAVDGGVVSIITCFLQRVNSSAIAGFCYLLCSVIYVVTTRSAGDNDTGTCDRNSLRAVHSFSCVESCE